MNEMVSTSISFFVMLNPFAMFVILEPLRRNMERQSFAAMLTRASLNSVAIFILFYLIGDIIFTRIFRIQFEAFRIFGGIIIFSFAYFYIVKDTKTLIQPKQNINDLALDVSVPFMVGAGTISFAILLGQRSSNILLGVGAIFGIMLANHLVILGMGYIRVLLKSREQYFDKYMDVAMRINIFIIGAIGVDMVIEGLRALFV